MAHATHPGTGKPYHWPDGDLPAREDLPELTEETARRFVELEDWANEGGHAELAQLLHAE